MDNYFIPKFDEYKQKEKIQINNNQQISLYPYVDLNNLIYTKKEKDTDNLRNYVGGNDSKICFNMSLKNRCCFKDDGKELCEINECSTCNSGNQKCNFCNKLLYYGN